MIKRLWIAGLLTMALTTMSGVLLLAHGDATHLAGTVTAVNPTTLTIKLQTGKSETVMLEKATKYLTGTKAATAADLKVGTRVVIDAKMDEKMKMYTAEEIRIGVADTAAAKAAPAAKAAKAAPAAKK
jgi:hypothetical protein